MKVLNLTQHNASPEQLIQGVEEPTSDDKKVIAGLLTFDQIPGGEELRVAAVRLATLAGTYGASQAMIGGAPFFMRALEDALVLVGIQPVYAFSVRESVDQAQEDGSTRKVAVFRHQGFVEGGG